MAINTNGLQGIFLVKNPFIIGKTGIDYLRKKIITYFVLLLAKKDFPALSNYKSPFFIISTPGSLHLVYLCLKYFPKDQNVVLVSNGLSTWEINWAKDNIIVDSHVLIKRTLPHSIVLDLVFDQYPAPFGIIDFDCFVLDPSLFQKIKILEPSTMMNAIFCYQNQELDLDMFETYFLFLNSPLINKIKRKFGVNSKVTTFKNLNNNLQDKLLTLGIDENQYPDLHRGKFFDTMRLWYLLGLTEGYKCNFIERLPFYPIQNNLVFHVGAGHKTNSLNTLWNTRGTYLWRRALEVCPYPELQTHYNHQFGNLKSSDIFNLVPDLCQQIGDEFFNLLEEII